MWGQAEGEDFDPDGMNLRVELDAAADMEFDDSEEEEGEEDASGTLSLRQLTGSGQLQGGELELIHL